MEGFAEKILITTSHYLSAGVHFGESHLHKRDNWQEFVPNIKNRCYNI